MKNNKNNIELIINGIKSVLIDECRLKKGENQIKIIIKNKLTNLEDMFSKINLIKDIDELKYLDTKEIKNFSHMFDEC